MTCELGWWVGGKNWRTTLIKVGWVFLDMWNINPVIQNTHIIKGILGFGRALKKLHLFVKSIYLSFWGEYATTIPCL